MKANTHIYSSLLIAVLCASGQQNWDDALISRMLTDGFEGIKSRFQKNEQ